MVDYLESSDEEQLTKSRVKKVKLPKIAEPKDDAPEDTYEKTLPPAKRQKTEKQLMAFKKAQEKRAENLKLKKEQKEEELVNKVLILAGIMLKDSDEEPAPKKKSRVGRTAPPVKPDLENLNYRTYFA